MKILITSIVDLKKAAHTRLHEFVRHLGRNHDLTILSINDHGKVFPGDLSKGSGGFAGTFPDVKFAYFTRRNISPALQEVYSFFTLPGILDEFRVRDFDVHLNYSSLVSGYAVARYLRRLGKRTVFDIADDLPAMVRGSPRISPVLRPAAASLGGLFFNRNILLAHQITIITDCLRKSVKTTLPKARVVPNGVDVDLFSCRDSSSLKRELGLEGSFVLGYAGALREWVDLESVYRALRELGDSGVSKPLKLLVVGEEGELAKNKELVQEYGLQDTVVFSGGVAYEQLPNYVSCMDVCLIPFKKNAVAENALPLKLFEYLACEKPVIATPLAGIKETVSERIVYASSVREIGQRILESVANPEKGITQAANNRRFVAENYSWRRACSCLEDILLESAQAK